MNDSPPGHGWWKASDDVWYPPEQHPAYLPAPPTRIEATAPSQQVQPPPDPSGSTPGRIGLSIVVLLLAVAAVVSVIGSVTDSAEPDEAPSRESEPAATSPPSEHERIVAVIGNPPPGANDGAYGPIRAMSCAELEDEAFLWLEESERLQEAGNDNWKIFDYYFNYTLAAAVQDDCPLSE